MDKYIQERTQKVVQDGKFGKAEKTGLNINN